MPKVTHRNVSKDSESKTPGGSAVRSLLKRSLQGTSEWKFSTVEDKPSAAWRKEGQNKGNRQVVRWCHVDVPTGSIIFFFHTLAPLSWLQTKHNQSHTKLDMITVRNEEKKKQQQQEHEEEKTFVFFNLSIHSFTVGRGINSFYATRKRKCHIQGRQWRKRVKDAEWQLRQSITLEKPERQQRMKVISDSRLGYCLVPMPLVAWRKISKRRLNFDSQSKE